MDALTIINIICITAWFIVVTIIILKVIKNIKSLHKHDIELLVLIDAIADKMKTKFAEHDSILESYDNRLRNLETRVNNITTVLNETIKLNKDGQTN